MKEYLEGLILQAYEKAVKLLGECKPSILDDRFQQLANTTNERLNSIITETFELFGEISSSEYIGDNKILLEYQLISQELEKYENVVLAVLSRFKNEDAYMTRLAHQACTEINYPLPSPIVSCLSQEYYCIYQRVNLICVPLLESHYLLHLPDFFHELGHPLLTAPHHPVTKKFQEKWVKFNQEIRVYFSKVVKETIGSNSRELINFFKAWERNWLSSKGESNWSTELFCDLFATCICGPAYGWSHLYLTTKRGNNPFRISMFAIDTHPNPDARMQAILYGLDHLGYRKEKEEIGEKWQEYLSINSFEKNDYQKFAYPTPILKKCASLALEAVEAAELVIYSKDQTNTIAADLNESWKTFWASPSTYSDWEKEKISSIREKVFEKP